MLFLLFRSWNKSPSYKNPYHLSQSQSPCHICSSRSEENKNLNKRRAHLWTVLCNGALGLELPYVVLSWLRAFSSVAFWYILLFLILFRLLHCLPYFALLTALICATLLFCSFYALHLLLSFGFCVFCFLLFCYISVLCCTVPCRVPCRAVCCAVRCAVPCRAVPCRAVPCAVLCSAVQCCAVQCCAVQCCAVLCCAVLYCTVPCRAVPCRAVLCCAVLCCAALLLLYFVLSFAISFLIFPLLSCVETCFSHIILPDQSRYTHPYCLEKEVLVWSAGTPLSQYLQWKK